MKQFAWLVVLIGVCAFCLPAQAQVPPSASQIEAFSPLHKAAHTGDLAALNAALAGGADINSRDTAGRTPLIVAAFASQYAAADALLEKKADTALLEPGKYDAVTVAAVKGDARMVRLLIKGGASAGLTTSIYDGTALIAAAHLGHADVVKALIDGGAPLDHINNLGWTAVIEAIVLGDGGKAHIETLRHLIEAGADLSIADRNGQTPLQLAEARGYDEMAAMLKRAGAK